MCNGIVKLSLMQCSSEQNMKNLRIVFVCLVFATMLFFFSPEDKVRVHNPSQRMGSISATSSLIFVKSNAWESFSYFRKKELMCFVALELKFLRTFSLDS